MPVVVKYRGISLTCYPTEQGGKTVWRFIWRDSRGRRRTVQRASLADIKREAQRKCCELAALPVEAPEPERPRSRSIGRVIEEFLRVKAANAGPSDRNIRTLRSNLTSLLRAIGSEVPLASVEIQDLAQWLDRYRDKAPKTRANLRAAAVTLFRWARRRGYLPDQTTAAERLDVPTIIRRIPETYTPAEMRTMLQACPAPYLPWLVLSAFCGLRYSELCPPSTGRKSPLQWSDVHWEEGFILVRPETAKTQRKRHAHFPEVAQAWLLPWRKSTGRCTPARYPNKVLKHEPSVTSQLGALVGGWKPNALRKSFISYSCAMHGLSQTARWAGNLESEAARSYNDSKSEADARAWFALFPDPGEAKNIVTI